MVAKTNDFFNVNFSNKVITKCVPYGDTCNIQKLYNVQDELYEDGCIQTDRQTDRHANSL